MAALLEWFDAVSILVRPASMTQALAALLRYRTRQVCRQSGQASFR
jgi:hypothetical protein